MKPAVKILPLVACVAAVLALISTAQLRGVDEKNALPPGKESRKAVPNAKAPQVQIVAKFIEIGADAAGDPAMDWLPAPPKPGSETGGGTIFLTDEQARDAVGLAGLKKGVDLISAPNVVTRSKQRAIVEIIREFRYANEWEKDEKRGAWKPSSFEMKNVGITLEIEPTVREDGLVMLHCAPSVVEFLGFIDLDAKGKAAQPKADLSKPLKDRLALRPAGEVPDGHRAQPVFSTHRVKADILMESGQTLLLECGPAEVENAAVGGKDSVKAEGEAQPRRLVILVTPILVKPQDVPLEKPAKDPGEPAK